MKLITFLFAVTAAVFLTSCRGTKETILPDSNQTERTVTVTLHDTVFTTKPDSSSLTAPLIVSPEGLVTLGKLKTEQGKYVQAPGVAIRDNVIQVDCYAEAQRLFHQWKETQIKESNRTVRTIIQPPKIVEKNLTFWQKTQIWFGRIFLLLLAIYGISLFIFHRLNKTIFNG